MMVVAVVVAVETEIQFLVHVLCTASGWLAEVPPSTKVGTWTKSLKCTLQEEKGRPHTSPCRYGLAFFPPPTGNPLSLGGGNKPKRGQIYTVGPLGLVASRLSKLARSSLQHAA